MLARIAARGAANQTEADYAVPKGLTLRDEIARYFRIGAALFKDFAASPTPSAGAALSLMDGLLSQVFGFTDVEARRDEGQTIALEAKKGRVPVVIVPPSDDLDRASAFLSASHGTELGRRRSAASSLQDWLNHTDQALWGFCTNGDQVRLMRDNASLTRPAFVEVNLRQIFESENFADFAAIWQLFHSTRFGAPGTPVTDCALERWHEAGASEGLVARDRLRDGVETALLAFGNGFLAHPENSSLRTRVTAGELPLPEFFGQLLRLVYRLIFLLVAEDRGLLHPPGASPSAAKLYAEGYSLSALRDRAIRRTAWDQHFDRWEGLLITFAGLAQGQPKIALPALGGLFDNVIPDLERARLSNRALMEAVYRLAWLKDDASLVPVNWRDMETEELGSVYESLLELTPILVDEGRGISFAEGDETKGNQRKTTGSYYTPDSLVQTLLDSALDPVLDRVESESNGKVQGLLGVTVIDPACGSGHFLLAAARRIAARVARARTGGVASAQDYRHALRDVVRSCVHGVDRNPMAVELTKVALWIETVEPGKPLGFLDASILCGDSLLGVFNLEVLREGIPDAAYKPLSGDDKDAAKYFERRNKAERDGQGTLDFTGGKNLLPAAPPLAASLRAVRNLPEDTTGEIAEKKKRLAAAKSERQLWSWRVAADLYIAAFLLPKKDAPREPGAALVPTTDHVWRTLSGGQVYGPLVGAARAMVDRARVFHWPLEFPEVMSVGGFDVVIGNPPWERIKLQEQEFFAVREAGIALAPTTDARTKMIANLMKAPKGTRERRLFEEFEVAKRTAEASSIFAREAGRFLLTGRGDVNTYALFAELFGSILNQSGRAGAIVPTGIATDATTAPYFESILRERRIISLHDFQTGLGYFDRIGHARFKFSLLTTGGRNSGPIDIPFSFFSRTQADFRDKQRHFTLSADDIACIHPNIRTVPIFRSRYDAELTAKIYSRVPVLIDERRSDVGNPWGVSLKTMFHMSNDSHLFRSSEWLEAQGFRSSGGRYTNGREQFDRLFEGRLGHQYNHRFASQANGILVETRAEELQSSSFVVTGQHYAPTAESNKWLSRHRNSCASGLLGFRRVARSDDERTVIASIIPYGATSYGWILAVGPGPIDLCMLCALFNSVVFDYCLRNSLNQPSIPQETMKQVAAPPPSALSAHARTRIVCNVVELTCTAWDLQVFLDDVWHNADPTLRAAIERQWHENRDKTGGHVYDTSAWYSRPQEWCPLPQFKWHEDRRAVLRAELDASYARAYGLTRDELRYILDPADVMGEDYPSETFRVLKNNEMKKFGEYRTRRLVLEAWNRMEAGDLK